jgi:predicted nucleotidyltransferase
MKPVEQTILDKIVQCIVEVAAPEKIILFGSAARGKMGPNSDVDLSDYAVETRYPGLAEPVTLQEYEEAVAIAEEVVEWAQSVIGHFDCGP